MRRPLLPDNVLEWLESALSLLLVGFLLAWPFWSALSFAQGLVIALLLLGACLLVSRFSPSERRLTAMLWRRHTTPLRGPSASASLRSDGAPHERVTDHGDA